MNHRLLVACDMDGTLLDTECVGRLRDREIAALQAVRDAGHVVAICTGRNNRSLSTVLDLSQWHPADLPKVTLNGAVVDGGEPYRRLAYNVLERDVVQRLIEEFRAFGARAMIYGVDEEGGRVQAERQDVNPCLARYLRHREDIVGGLDWVDDLLVAAPAQALEVGTIDLAEVVVPLTAAIRAGLGDQVRVINTRSLLGEGQYYWAEVYHGACSKGTGLRHLAAAYGIAPGRVVAIGDNYNDLDMFAEAAVSVAMSEGPADVCAAADVVTSSAAAVLEAIAAGTFPEVRS
jgi:hydroxymethylpyrimidine pyrophosphatase-like HAD family hydrolase